MASATTASPSSIRSNSATSSCRQSARAGGLARYTHPSSMSSGATALIVGAGYAGSVTARELAEAGWRVHVIDKRPHIAGNAYDEPDAHGVLVHRYGPHIFHTNGERIFQWLSRFTQW